MKTDTVPVTEKPSSTQAIERMVNTRRPGRYAWKGFGKWARYMVPTTDSPTQTEIFTDTKRTIRTRNDPVQCLTSHTKPTDEKKPRKCRPLMWGTSLTDSKVCHQLVLAQHRVQFSPFVLYGVTSGRSALYLGQNITGYLRRNHAENR